MARPKKHVDIPTIDEIHQEVTDIIAAESSSSNAHATSVRPAPHEAQYGFTSAEKKRTDTTPQTPASVMTTDRIKIFERRLQSPHGQSTAPIDFKDPTLVGHWFNSAIAADKIWRAKNSGWVPVRPEDLLDLDQIGGFVKSADGYVTRGDRGQEVLMCMPRVWRDKIAMAKTRENLKNMGDPQATKREVVEAAGHKLGDEAADYLHRKMNVVGGVRDQHERVERLEDGLE